MEDVRSSKQNKKKRLAIAKFVKVECLWLDIRITSTVKV